MNDSLLRNLLPKALFSTWNLAPGDDDAVDPRIRATGVGIPVGWLTHVAYVFLFAFWGVWPLAAFNVISAAIWTAVLFLWRQRRWKLVYSLIFAEVAIHAFLVIRYLGWGFGVQYYLLLVMQVGFLMPWPRRTSILITALSAALFILLYYYAESTPPLTAVPPVQLAALNVVNIASVFATSALTVLYFRSVAETAQAALAAEHARSEALLNNVLPMPIAARLKQDNATIAEGFQNASILFADIAGFTPFSEKISPEEVVAVLNSIFSRFDELVDAYGLEKIKTVGDAYMVAAGIPTPREDHAEVLARFALAMRDELLAYNRAENLDLQLRIGLNSGPVVAGVIGKRRFLYDLWGDSVNTAARMESHGKPGEIQITDAMRRLLGDTFAYVDRGVIEVKGKGPMHVYFLHSKNGALEEA
jgi:adenylate cyclase